jgi:tripartite-type tricarboxylate transporter receptor subunit TctC
MNRFAAQETPLNMLRAISFVAAALAGIANAQTYPVKPVRIISPYPPGGGNDTISRLIADKLTEQFSQRVIVDNRPGANTVVGTEILAKSAPDGYTLIVLPNSLATNPSFYPNLPYDTLRDFAPVAQIAQSPQMIVVHPSFPATTLKQLLALAKSKPGDVSYGTSGNGSIGHLAMLLLTEMSGVKFTNVPYKGTAPAVNDVLGGHIPMMMASMISVLPQARAGKLRIIALTAARRSPALPDVPTIAEAGVPGYEATLWYGMVAPARTPEPIVKRINAELATALRSPDLVERLSTQAVEPHHTTPEQFGALIRGEVAKWGKVITATGVKAD